MQDTAIKKIGIYVTSVAAIALTVAVFKSLFPGATPATVALVFVVEVLFAAIFGGFGPSLLVALIASLCFNFFFLPPYGTFNIAHPADVVSFCIFLITAIVVSKLSSSERQRAVEAEHRKDEVERLLKFAKLLIETPDTIDGAASIANRIVDIFKVEYAGIYVPDQTGKWKHVSVSSDELKSINLPQPETLRSNTIAEMLDEYGKGVKYTSMNTPTRTIGVIALRAPNLSKDTIAAIASLVALTVERNRLIYQPS